MAIMNVFSVSFNVLGDGTTTTTFTLDLNRDSYNITPTQQNWSPKTLAHVEFNDTRIASATIVGGVITLTFTSAFSGVYSMQIFVS